MTKKAGRLEPSKQKRRRAFTAEFRQEAVQMLLDGHSAASVAERLGLAGTNLLYRWKREQLDGHSAASVAERLGLAGTNLLYRWKREQLERTGPVATSLEARVRELEIELHRVERERDILKKALVIFGRQE